MICTNTGGLIRLPVSGILAGLAGVQPEQHLQDLLHAPRMCLRVEDNPPFLDFRPGLIKHPEIAILHHEGPCR